LEGVCQRRREKKENRVEGGGEKDLPILRGEPIRWQAEIRRALDQRGGQEEGLVHDLTRHWKDSKRESRLEKKGKKKERDGNLRAGRSFQAYRHQNGTKEEKKGRKTISCQHKSEKELRAGRPKKKGF